MSFLYVTLKEPQTNLFGVEDAVAEDVVTVSLWDIGMRSVESPARGLDGAHMNPCGALGWGIYHFIEKIVLPTYVTQEMERERYSKRERER